MSSGSAGVEQLFRVSAEKKPKRNDNHITILHRSRWLQQYIGLGGYQENEERYGWFRITILTSLMIFVITTSSINLFRFVTNMDILPGLLFAVCIYMIWLGSYLTAVLKRKQLQKITRDIQKTVNKRVYFIY